METTTNDVHHGYNIRRLREILNVKQSTVAADLNISQQAMSKLEQKSKIDDDMLEKISNVLKIPVNIIKNLNEKLIVNTLVNLFNDSSKTPFDSTGKEDVIEVYQQLLKAEQEKIVLLERLLKIANLHAK